MVKAVFLDRDGTIIEDTGYVGECSRVNFLPGVSEAIALLNRSGFKVIIITNQAGVARGYFTEAAVQEVNEFITASLARQGAFIDKVYYCPHHTEAVIAAYRRDCPCRKPNPGMIELAVREFNIDVKNSFLVGDKTSDIEAGRRAGCRTILITNGNISNKEPEFPPPPDLSTVPDLSQAVKYIVASDG